MDLVGPGRPLEADLIGDREPATGPRDGVVVVVEVAVVDLVGGPAEDAEGVVGTEVGEGEVEGASAGGPGGGGVEEEVTDEVVVGGVWGGVDAEPVEGGRGGGAGPLNVDRVVGFGEEFGGGGDGGVG